MPNMQRVRSSISVSIACGLQGDDTQSRLTDLGRQQAAQVREALANIHFDRQGTQLLLCRWGSAQPAHPARYECSCFSSPIPRARQFAEIVWQGREGEPTPMQPLKEAHLGFLQGMLNCTPSRVSFRVLGLLTAGF